MRKFLCFIVAISTPILAIDVAKLTDKQVLLKEVSYFEDTASAVTIKDISGRSSDFKPIETDSINFGYSDSTYWLKFGLENNTPKSITRMIELAESSIDHARVYLMINNNVLYQKTTGRLTDFGQRDVPHRNFLFKLNLDSWKKYTCFIAIKSSSSLTAPLVLYTPEAFGKKDRQEQSVYGLYYGIMIALILVNLFIFITANDNIYLWYICFIASLAFFVLIQNSVAFELFWPDAPVFNSRMLTLFGSMMMLFMLNLGRNFLNVKEHLDILNKIFLGLIAFYGINGILALFIPTQYIDMLIPFYLVANILAVLFTGVFVFIKGFKQARYFVLAFLLMGLIIAAADLELLEVVTDFALEIGTAVTAIVLSMALRDRVYTLEYEKDHLEKERLSGRVRFLESSYRFVPKQFLQSLGRGNVERIEPGESREKKMTVLYCDIRKFTGLSGTMTAEENVLFLNSYLQRMTPIITNNGGFVDRFLSDAILALFNDSDSALNSAIAMQAHLREYNKHRNHQLYPPIEIGIGLTAGTIVLGTLGSETSLGTTIIGESVSIASPVEALNKLYKTGVILSEVAVESLKEPEKFSLRLIDNIIVRGKNEPMKIYECFDIDPDEFKQKKLNAKDDFAAALDAYNNGNFPQAQDSFEAIIADNADDLVGQMYVKRCIRLTKKPPGEGWAGISKVR